tara:strand:- start:10429 stop:10749 length:321 start_codon:yes stop_codon:yes gene_type:complete
MDTPDRVRVAVSIGLIALILVLYVINRKSDKYLPKPITVKPAGDTKINALEDDIACIPGPGEKSAYYTRRGGNRKTFTPGGVCGGQKSVEDSANYEIVDGIGGLLI